MSALTPRLAGRARSLEATQSPDRRSLSRRHGWAAAAAIAVVLLSLVATPHARADVGDDGAFSTSVAIEVPSFHGIEPSIAVSYDSSRPAGLAGVGWRLDTASYIARAGRHGGAPRFDGTDVFLLDGERLIECAPKCARGGTHETRRRDFTRITFDGARWTRWRTDGVRHTYELLPMATSTGKYRWGLKQVTDTHGNTVRYEHACDGSECYLDSIAYADGPVWCSTPGPGWEGICFPGALGARIRFYYEDRPDPVSYGTGAGLAVTAKRLKSIAVRMGGELVRAYALSYAASSSTGNSLLRSVQTFPSDATVDGSGTVIAGETQPLPPTEFGAASMSSGSPGPWSTKTETTGGLTSLAAVGLGNPDQASVYADVELPNPAGVPVVDYELGDPLPSTTVAGDFDNDGRTDVAAVGIAASPCKGINVRTALARSAGEEPVFSSAASSSTNQFSFANHNGFCAVAAFAGDVDGDGGDDLVLMNGKSWLTVGKPLGDGRFSFDRQWTATGFVQDPIAMPRCSIADVDADGRSDVACFYKESASVSWFGAARSRAGGGFTVTKTNLSPAGVTDMRLARTAIGDVNADRKADLILAVATAWCGAPCGTWTLVAGYANGSGGVADWPSTPTTWSAVKLSELRSGDVNGDGRADAVLTSNPGWASDGSKLPNYTYVATSTKDASAAFGAKPPVTGCGVAVGDSNGDGRDDIWGLGLAGDDGQFPSTSYANPSCGGEDDGIVVGDTNGDGRADTLSFGQPDPTGENVYTVSDSVAPVRPADPFRWMPADVTGTGRQDLVYVHFRNPGYEVYTLRREPAGTFTRSSAPISPEAGMPLTNPNAGAWMPIDVGGGASGAADGRPTWSWSREPRQNCGSTRSSRPATGGRRKPKRSAPTTRPTYRPGGPPTSTATAAATSCTSCRSRPACVWSTCSQTATGRGRTTTATTSQPRPAPCRR